MKVLLAWLAVCLIWSTTWLFIKLGLRDLAPISFVSIRFAIAAVVLLIVIFVQRTPLPRQISDWVMISVTGVLIFAINYGLLFWAEQHISSGLAAVLQATIPAFGLVLAHYYVPDERLTLVKIGAVGLGLLGVAVVFSDQLQIAGRLALFGCAATVTGAFAAAYANVLAKAYSKHLPLTVLTAGQMVCGLVPLVVLGIVREGNPFAQRWTLTAIASLLYLAIIGSVTAFWLFYWLLRHDLTKAMMVPLITPLGAVLLGAAVLGERLMWRTLAGGAAVLTSVLLILVHQKISHQAVTSQKAAASNGVAGRAVR